MISLIVAIIAFGFIIIFHELGHFLFAKLFSVGVVNFSIGMGPKLWSKVMGNTEYSLRVLPFGGSCMMVGEELDEQEPEEADRDIIVIDGRAYKASEQFVRKRPWQRLLIVCGGALFNFILAFLLSIVICSEVGTDLPVVTAVETDMPAYGSGIEAGDLISGIYIGDEGRKIHLSRELYLFLYLHGASFSENVPVRLSYIDHETGKEGEAVFYPAYSEETKSVRMGISYSLSYVRTEGIFDTIRYSFYNIGYCLSSTFESLKLILTGGVERTDVMGPVRLVSTIDETVEEAYDYGLWTTLMSLFNMMIIISASLGISNLLPIPALDGGRLIFIVIEMLTRHAVPKEIEAKIHIAGMAFLLLLMVLIMVNDISLII